MLEYNILEIVDFVRNILYSLPLWLYAALFVAVISTFHGFQRMVETKHRRLAFTLSFILSIPFFVAWSGFLICRPYTLQGWIIVLFYLWAYITLIETARRDLQAQWLRNIISLTVEIPLIYTVVIAGLNILSEMPDIFEWVDAEDTFWSMVWHCALIIAAYFAIAYLIDRFIIRWIFPGGSQWSLILVTLALFANIYWSSLDAIDGLYGFNYCLGVVILAFGAFLAWCISFSSMDKERCPRCHRYDAVCLGHSHGGYEEITSYKTVRESELVDRHEKVLETRRLTNYQHKCCYCGEKWTTTLSSLVSKERETTGYTYWRYE